MQYHDQYVPHYSIGPDVFRREKLTLTSVPLDDDVVKACDAVVIVTGHRNVDYQRVIDLASGVVDCCNVTLGLKGAGATGGPPPREGGYGQKIVRLGVG